MRSHSFPTTAAERHGAGAVARLLATIAALLTGQTLLWWSGAALPSLPLDRAGAATAFAEADPLALAIAMVRLVALAVGTGLLAVTALGVAARCCGAAWLRVHLDRWTPAGIRRLLDGALGIGLAASIGVSAVPAGAQTGHPPPAATTIHRLPDAPSATLRRLPDTRGNPAAAPAGLSLRRLPDVQPAPPRAPPSSAEDPPADPLAAPGPAAVPSPTTTPEAPTAAPAAPPATDPPAAPSPPSPAPVAAAEVVVQPGESFWLLAERHETNRLGRQPTEAEVGACWQELVARNRHRLAVPGDPDLLFPGQRLILPCP